MLPQVEVNQKDRSGLETSCQTRFSGREGRFRRAVGGGREMGRNWKLAAGGFLLLLTAPFSVRAGDCQSLLQSLKLPAELKTKGKPAVARWDKVDKVLTGFRERANGMDCRITLGQVFRSGKKEVFFPLTNNVLRTVPEASLAGVSVFSTEGELLGEFSNLVTYERSGGLYARDSYSLVYFQFTDRRGELQSSGNRLLLDTFVVKWSDIRDQPALEDP